MDVECNLVSFSPMATLSHQEFADWMGLKVAQVDNYLVEKMDISNTITCLKRIREEDFNPLSPFHLLDNEILSVLLKKINYIDLKTCRQINQRLKHLVDKITSLSKFLIFDHVAFSPLHWNKHWGALLSEAECNEAFHSLSNDIYDFFQLLCPITGGIVLHSHRLFYIPKTFRGIHLSVNSFAAFLRGYYEFFGNPKGYQSIPDEVIEQIGNVPIEPGWCLMMADVLKESYGKSYEIQKLNIQSLNEKYSTYYKLGQVGEAIIGIYTAHFEKKPIFGGCPLTFIQLEDLSPGKRLIAGGFNKKGLSIANVNFDYEGNIGIAPILRIS